MRRGGLEVGLRWRISWDGLQVVEVLGGSCVDVWLCCLIRLHVFAALSITSQTIPLLPVAKDGVSIIWLDTSTLCLFHKLTKDIKCFLRQLETSPLHTRISLIK